MPSFQSKLPFQFHSFRGSEDIQLLSTHNISLVLNLIEFFHLEDEISEDIQTLFDPSPPDKKTVVIVLRSKPEKGDLYAYAALLECDLCGVQKGFFAMFKSLSGDLEALTKESTAMFEFLNEELLKQNNLEAVLKP
jgi:hypothetical protein